MSQWRKSELLGGIPSVAGALAGGIGGGNIGWRAADAIAPESAAAPKEPSYEQAYQNFLDDHPNATALGSGTDLAVVEHMGLTAIGIAAGSELGNNNPAKGILILGTLVAEHVIGNSHHQADHGKDASSVSLTHEHSGLSARDVQGNPIGRDVGGYRPTDIHGNPWGADPWGHGADHGILGSVGADSAVGASGDSLSCDVCHPSEVVGL